MRSTITILVIALLAAACGGSDENSGIATLDETTTTVAGDQGQSGQTDEEILLEFTGCMRSEGVELGDPIVDANGFATLDFESFGDIDQDDAEAAFSECGSLLEGLAFGFDQIDTTDFRDTLLEFSQCMRDQGVDFPDPDFSNLFQIPQDGEGEFTGPFGDLDPTDPDIEAAFAQCDDILAGFGPPGS
ncbi:MAG: hypothetical protein KJN71_01300 [Acidimicrobiia bacterium]|nr:hypothetical protein [Acidimicrobiia bacterium]